MKRLFFLFFVVIFGIQCNRGDNLNLAFEMEYPNIIFEIPAGLNTIESHFFLLKDIPTAKNFFFGDIPEEDIQAIVPSYARMTALDGNSIDYDFLFEVSVRICQPNKESNCLREIFYRDRIPNNVGNRLDLIPNDNNLKEILTQDDFTIEVVLKRLVSTSPTFINSRLEMGFEARR